MSSQPQSFTADASFFDNTMLGAYKECPRKYYLRHILGWRSEGLSAPLAFGLAWHAGQDIIWQHAKKIPPRELAQVALAAFMDTWTEQGMPENMTLEEIERLTPRTPGVAGEMYANYIEQRWSVLTSCELIACEQPFAVPLPQTEDIWYIGRLDKVAQIGVEKVVVEHKTTTEYKKDGGFRSTYVESWASDSQIKGYEFGAGMFFPGVRQVWVDAALVHKQVHNAFRFIPIAHQMPLLEEWLADTRSWVNRILSETDTYADAGLLPGLFPKNENSCMGKYGACPFLNICRTTADPSKLNTPPAGYVKEFWKPFELLGLDKLIKETT